MKVTILGTGSANPVVGRRPSAVVVKLPNTTLLIDCGEGTQFALLENKISYNKIDLIAVSHLHADHYLGLIGLLLTMNLIGRRKELTIIAPPELKEIISIQLKSSNSIIEYPISFHATQNKTFENLIDFQNLNISTFPLSHRVKTTGFVIRTEKNLRNVIANKLPEGLPIELIKKLKLGEDIIDPKTNNPFKNSDLTKEGLPVKSFAYCSDTKYLPEICPYIKEVDLLYHEATFASELESRAEKTFHSTAKQAGLIAKEANVKQLVISHYSSRYKSLDIHLEEAKEVFENTLLGRENLEIFI